MPSPFPGMDPFLEQEPIFHELHLQMIAWAQNLLQPQLQPNYAARLRIVERERYLVLCTSRRPRQVVTEIRILKPSTKCAFRALLLNNEGEPVEDGRRAPQRVVIDLLRQGQVDQHPWMAVKKNDYMALIDFPTRGRLPWLWEWGIQDRMPVLPIPLLGDDQVRLDLSACFRQAYEAIAPEDDADYPVNPPPPPLRAEDAAWVDALLRQGSLRS